MKRVIFDCYKLVKGKGKSIGIYNVALNLLENLVGRNDSGEIKYFVIGNKHNRDDFDIPGATFVDVGGYPLNNLYCAYWELYGVVRIYKKLKGDLIIFPRGYTAISKDINDVVIVHDMIPFYYHSHYPDAMNKLKNAYVRYRLKKSVEKAKGVVTVSYASRDEIKRIVPNVGNRIKVIHNGLNRIDAKPMGHDNYIVAMTSGLPHKNAIGIVRSYENYCGISENPLPLVIIGIADTDFTNIDSKAAKNIMCRKYIESNDEMHSLIGKSRIFLFLSEIEGFGFPPIEAMELGVPVICSNCSSLPEIVGEAALLVDPYDYDNVGRAIDMLQNDSALQGELIKKGKENIKRFSWDKIACEYESFLMAILYSNGGT